jgi:hypothetical protein
MTSNPASKVTCSCRKSLPAAGIEPATSSLGTRPGNSIERYKNRESTHCARGILHVTGCGWIARRLPVCCAFGSNLDASGQHVELIWHALIVTSTHVFIVAEPFFKHALRILERDFSNPALPERVKGLCIDADTRALKDDQGVAPQIVLADSLADKLGSVCSSIPGFQEHLVKAGGASGRFDRAHPEISLCGVDLERFVDPDPILAPVDVSPLERQGLIPSQSAKSAKGEKHSPSLIWARVDDQLQVFPGDVTPLLMWFWGGSGQPIERVELELIFVDGTLEHLFRRSYVPADGAEGQLSPPVPQFAVGPGPVLNFVELPCQFAGRQRRKPVCSLGPGNRVDPGVVVEISRKIYAAMAVGVPGVLADVDALRLIPLNPCLQADCLSPGPSGSGELGAKLPAEHACLTSTVLALGPETLGPLPAWRRRIQPTGFPVGAVVDQPNRDLLPHGRRILRASAIDSRKESPCL